MNRVVHNVTFLYAGTFAVVALMVGESINKVLVNYPAVDAACHISMSSLDVNGGVLNGTNTTYEACATMDECREMCQTVTTSIAITIAFVTGVIMVRTCMYVHAPSYIYACSLLLHLRMYVCYRDGNTKVCTYVHVRTYVCTWWYTLYAL